MKKQRDSSTDGQNQISSLQVLIDQSGRNKYIEANLLIQALKKTIENQECKLNRFQVIIKQQKMKIKWLQNEYNKEKINSQKLKKQLCELICQQQIISSLRTEVNMLRQQKKEQAKKQIIRDCSEIQQLGKQIQKVKQKLKLQNKNLKILISQKQNKIQSMKISISKFLQKCQQLFISCQKFEYSLLTQIKKLRNNF